MLDVGSTAKHTSELVAYILGWRLLMLEETLLTRVDQFLYFTGLLFTGLQCEGLFQSSSANPRLADRLRVSLDLESSNDVSTTALLLIMWLKELPEPIVWGHVAAELLSVHDSK